MSNEVSNTQTPLASETPATTGPTVVELQAQMESLKRESEGRLRDLQSERAKRQELEARSPVPAPSADPQSSDVTQDELGRVLKPYIDPVLQRVKAAEQFVAKTYEDKALDYLAQQTGKSKEAILQDKDFQDRLTGVARRYGFQGNIYDVTQKVYKVMELENLEAKEMERKRTVAASGSSSMPSGAPVPPVASGKLFTQSEWSAMPLYEYEKLAASGSFHEDESGKIVFTPNK